jgi:hypothetical protein
MRVTIVTAASIVLSALASAACSSSDDGGAGGGAKVPPAEGPITEIPAGWYEVAPGGATTCAHGDPYKFWVRKGTVNRVVIDFSGGGACWSPLTCLAGDELYQSKAEPPTWMASGAAALGIYDHENPDNPFKDWHHVYLAYCTGDVHWGDNAKDYGAPLDQTIQHKGAVNAKIALDWIYEKVPNPDKVMVTGCSAGGYGAALWSAAVSEHYANAKVYQLADSAAGIITDTFFQESFPSWNATSAIPPTLGIDPQKFAKLSELYVAIGKTYPATFLSQYNTAYDSEQTKYFKAMGGTGAEEWSSKMQASLAEIQAGDPAFRYYMAPDSQHCIIGKANFYTLEVGGKRWVDWIDDVIGDKEVTTISCKSSDCGKPAP